MSLNLSPLWHTEWSGNPVPANLQTNPRCETTVSCSIHPHLEVNWTRGGNLRPCVQQTPNLWTAVPWEEAVVLPLVSHLSQYERLWWGWSAQAAARHWGESVSLHGALNWCVCYTANPFFPCPRRGFPVGMRLQALCDQKPLIKSDPVLLLAMVLCDLGKQQGYKTAQSVTRWADKAGLNA